LTPVASSVAAFAAAEGALRGAAVAPPFRCDCLLRCPSRSAVSTAAGSRCALLIGRSHVPGLDLRAEARVGALRTGAGAGCRSRAISFLAACTARSDTRR